MTSKKDGEQAFFPRDAQEFLLKKGDIYLDEKIVKFGKLRLPKGSEEAKQCEALKNMMIDFAGRKKPARPLSIAVFGPPGSGKSFGVKELAKEAGLKHTVTINLSQLNTIEDLASALKKATPGKKQTGLFFFDEFDADLDGQPLGWLKWFLAPMQDGEYLFESKTLPIKKAIFVFAGGTAHNFQDFQKRHGDYFGKVKGPDFVSRLRGFLNIEGLNTTNPSERILRRAMILQHLVGARSSELKNENGTLNVEEDLLQSLLSVGFYIHGARSMEALLDMSLLTKKKKFTHKNLPSQALLNLHVSRGPMDKLTIGLSTSGIHEKKLKTNLPVKLLEYGASLAYGGDLRENGELEWLIKQENQRASDLVPKSANRIQSYLAYPVFNEPGFKKKGDVDYHQLNTLTMKELEAMSLKPGLYFKVLGNNYCVKDHLAWSLSLFRMRLCLMREIDALIVIGGNEEVASGRFQGITEEVMLALAFGVPVYILGIGGGMASLLGHFMGLARVQQTNTGWLDTDNSDAYKNHSFDEMLEKWGASFHIPSKPDLPKSFNELGAFFSQHAPGGEKWPFNGLTLRENRDLFNSKEADECIDLIIRGISRLDWRKG